MEKERTAQEVVTRDLYIEKMVKSGQELLAALESRDGKAISEAAGAFSKAVDDAWQAYLRSEIPTQVRGQALPRTMHRFATEELPAMVTSPQQWPAVAREIRLFLKMTGVIVGQGEAPDSA